MALGTTMAMAERPGPGWASYQNPTINNCQDMGNSILLLLGLIICINIGINLVTLVRDGGCGWGDWVGGYKDLPEVTMSSYT